MSKRKANQISVEPQEILKVIKDTFTPTDNFDISNFEGVCSDNIEKYRNKKND